MDPLTALTALAPLGLEFGKAMLDRLRNGDFTPKNVAEWLDMRKADVELFKAMNDAGQGPPTFQWVGAIIQLQRPAIGALVLGTWALQEMTQPTGASASCANFASAVGFYLFGDRTLFHIRQRAGGVR